MREMLLAIAKTGAGTFLSLLFSAVRTKVIAVVLGPSGIGAYSLLQQALQTTGTLATFNGGAALIQGLSSRSGEDRQDYLATVARIYALGGIAIAVGLMLSAPLLAGWILARHDPQAVGLIRWLAVPVLLSSGNAFVMGVLNGYRAIGRMAMAQVAAAAAALALAYPVARWGGSDFLILLLVATSGTGLLVSLAFAARAGWLRPLRRWFRAPWTRGHVRHFFSIALTTLATGFAATGSVLAIRAILVRQGGLSTAGIFDVAWTLSMTYVMLALGSLGTYYLPTLSATREPGARVVLMQRTFRVTTMLMVPLVTAVIVFKPLVVQLFYSREFYPALKIIRWMLIADYLKATGWVLAMPMLAYADMKVFLWTEVLSAAVFTAAAIGSVQYWGQPQCIGIAFLAQVAGYLVFVLHYARSRHGLKLGARTMALWVAGLLTILGASATAWDRVDCRVGLEMGWVGVAMIVSMLGISRAQWSRVLRWAKEKAG